jgi:DNA polymerase I-like protein with 3'-5' exonuclease and polymerase domains
MIYALDIETKGPGERGALHHLDNEITIIGVWSPTEQHVFKDIVHFLLWHKDENKYVGHNLKFDLKTLYTKGADLRANYHGDSMLKAIACPDKISDLWLEEYEVRRQSQPHKGHRKAGRYSLKTLAPYFLSVPEFWETEDHDNIEYVLKDAEYSYKLYEFFGSTERFYDRLLMYSKTLLQAELNGIPINKKLILETQARLTKEQVEIEEGLRAIWATHIQKYEMEERTELLIRYQEMAAKRGKSFEDSRYKDLYNKALTKLEPFNLSSPSQLLWLFKELQLPILNMAGKESTGREVLETLNHLGREDIKLFIKWRENNKLLNSYVIPYLECIKVDRIYTNFNLSGARTGRLSSNDINCQQIPPELKHCFEAPQGYVFLFADMSAIEPKLLAYFSEDTVLLNTIAAGVDFHGLNAKYLFNLNCDPNDVKKEYPNERMWAKTCGLAMMYGAGKNRLIQTLSTYGIKYTEEEAILAVNNFRGLYKQYFDWKRNQLDNQLQQGGVIEQLLGRRYTLPEDDVYMKGVNTLIQGSASDLVLNSAHKFMNIADPSTELLALVHDEICVLVKEENLEAEKTKLIEAMTNYTLEVNGVKIPLTVEVKYGRTWQK